MPYFHSSLRSLSVLCVSAVKIDANTFTAEAQRSQRRRREFQIRAPPERRACLWLRSFRGRPVRAAAQVPPLNIRALIDGGGRGPPLNSREAPANQNYESFCGLSGDVRRRYGRRHRCADLFRLVLVVRTFARRHSLSRRPGAGLRSNRLDAFVVAGPEPALLSAAAILLSDNYSIGLGAFKSQLTRSSFPSSLRIQPVLLKFAHPFN